MKKPLTLSALICMSVVWGCLDTFPEYQPVKPDAFVPTRPVASAVPCNGVDDDLDGDFDETPEDTSCMAGIGICAGEGTLQCVRDSTGWTQACVIPNQSDSAPEETCSNGADDDCDGRTDEGCVCSDGDTQDCYDGNPATRGVGICADGEQSCSGGAFDQCEGTILPRIEECNGLDDNCSGEVDEGDMPCSTRCETGVGQCITTDSGEHVIVNCSAQAPRVEECDNIDNDCDGVVDEDVPTDNDKCPVIEGCRGVQTCVAGELVCQMDSADSCGCEPLPLAGARYQICRSMPLDQDRAASFCRSNGLGALVSLNSFSEHMRLFHALKQFGIADNVWVDGIRNGSTATLSDATILDPYLFTNGDLETAGQRNRITLDVSTGLLHARSVTAVRPFVCERLCDRSDTDQDLVTQCDGDCDDGNRDVKPSVRETVGDGIDNNCNGVIDEVGPELCNDGVDNDGDGTEDEDDCMSNCFPFWRDGTMTVVCLNGMNWTQALNTCTQHGLHLAEIRNFEDWRLLWAWFEAPGVRPNRDHYWFGLRRSGDGFRYEQTQDIIGADAPQWGPGQPDDFRFSEDCVELWCEQNYNQCSGTWNDQNCGNPRSFLCETAP